MAVDISNFLYLFNIKHNNFNGLIQKDSQEFCRLLLDDVSRELNRVVNIAKYEKLIFSNPQSKIQYEKEFYQFNLDREDSFITDNFYSTIMTQYTCICKYMSYSFQKILDYPLDLPCNIKKIELIDLLKTSFFYRLC